MNSSKLILNFMNIVQETTFVILFIPIFLLKYTASTYNEEFI